MLDHCALRSPQDEGQRPTGFPIFLATQPGTPARLPRWQGKRRSDILPSPKPAAWPRPRPFLCPAGGSPGLDHAMVEPTKEPPQKSADQVRQGVTGHHVRLVLVTSLVLLVIAFAALWFAYFG